MKKSKSKLANWCSVEDLYLLLSWSVVVAYIWKFLFVCVALNGEKSIFFALSPTPVVENFLDARFKSVPRFDPIYFRPNGFSFDLYAFVGENETSFESESKPVWVLKNLTYSQLDNFHDMQTSISISESVQNNGCIYLHLYLVRSGILPSSFKDHQINGELCCFIYPSESKVVHRSKRLNLYKRKTLTEGQFSDELHSHWHPNLTINLIHRPTEMQNVDSADFYFNDQFNLLRDYQPINRTTKSLPLHLTFTKLDSYMFWRYREISENPATQFGNVRFMKYAAGFFGWFDRRLIQTEKDQDLVREKLIESNFYLSDSGFTFRNGDPLGSFFSIAMLFWFTWEWGGISDSLGDPYKHLKTVSLRSIWFELIQSLVTFHIPIHLVVKLRWWLENRMKKDDGFEYDPQTNRLDAVVIRLFAILIFLPSLVGYLIYAYFYDSYKSFSYHIPMVFYDFFWNFGSIIWIPQLYLNYKLKSYHNLFLLSTLSKISYFIGQIFCRPYFINTGLFWLILKYHPTAILGQLINSVVCFIMFDQILSYTRIFDYKDEELKLQEMGRVHVVDTMPDLIPDQVLVPKSRF